MERNKYYFKVDEKQKVLLLTEGLHNDLIFDEVTKEINPKIQILSKEKYNELINQNGIIFYQNNDFVVKQIPASPREKYLNYKFNEDIWEWELVTTKEELILKKINLMSEYKEIKGKIKIAEEFEDEFEADDSIDLLKQKQVEIKAEINELTKLIKSI